MSLAAFAIVNGILAVGILATLSYVCRLPFHLDRVQDEPAATPGAMASVSGTAVEPDEAGQARASRRLEPALSAAHAERS
jgi:hypothetical protein